MFLVAPRDLAACGGPSPRGKKNSREPRPLRQIESRFPRHDLRYLRYCRSGALHRSDCADSPATWPAYDAEGGVNNSAWCVGSGQETAHVRTVAGHDICPQIGCRTDDHGSHADHGSHGFAGQPGIISTAPTVRFPRRTIRKRPWSRSPAAGAASTSVTFLLLR